MSDRTMARLHRLRLEKQELQLKQKCYKAISDFDRNVEAKRLKWETEHYKGVPICERCRNRVGCLFGPTSGCSFFWEE